MSGFFFSAVSPYTPLINFKDGYPTGLELHIAEGIISVNPDVILTVELTPDLQAVYNLKNENDGTIEFGEGLTDIRLLGGFIGLGALVLVSVKVASLVKEEITKKSKQLESNQEHGFVFRLG